MDGKPDGQKGACEEAVAINKAGDGDTWNGASESPAWAKEHPLSPPLPPADIVTKAHHPWVDIYKPDGFCSVGWGPGRGGPCERH